MSNISLSDAMQLEILQGIPVARLASGALRFDQAVSLMTEFVRTLAARGEHHLLIDARLVSFAAPSLAERLEMVRELAVAANGRLRIAMVTRSDFIDPERFGVVAAGKFGLAAQVFEQDADAIAWLLEERAAELRRG